MTTLTTKTMPKVKTMLKPSAEQIALWRAYADLDRLPRAPYVARALAAWKARRPLRTALAPLVSALLRDGLTPARVRDNSRRGLALPGMTPRTSEELTALALALEDLAFEETDAGRQETVHAIRWAVCRAYENARRRARAGRGSRFQTRRAVDFAEAA